MINKNKRILCFDLNNQKHLRAHVERADLHGVVYVEIEVLPPELKISCRRKIRTIFACFDHAARDRSAFGNRWLSQRCLVPRERVPCDGRFAHDDEFPSTDGARFCRGGNHARLDKKPFEIVTEFSLHNRQSSTFCPNNPVRAINYNRWF